VRRQRKALDLTQQELAQRVGCSVSAILKIEADERRPSRQVAELLARHLQIPADQTPLFLKVARQEKSVESLGEISTSNQHSPHPISHVPPSPGLLVGRDFELSELARLIQQPQCRLLTLTGPGGVGKTHLATHLAISLETSESGLHVVFVSLAAVTGREQSVTAMADAMGIVLYTASDRARQLISYLHDRAVLLIVDNFEHLITDKGCVDLIGDLLHETHQVKMIVTSREPLKLQAEWVFEVQGLPVSKNQSPEAAETDTSAVSLFIQRANQAFVGFTPTSQDLAAIVRICELVEGLPLAIELAAAWVRSLSCVEIVKEIENSLDFLANSVWDLPERHRSMRATIEHSWKLLTPEEQRVLRRLSIFRGGFSRQAAQAVTDASLTDLLSLVSKSIIRRTKTGRYDLHELIHQYVLYQLRQDSAEYEQMQASHSRYFAGLLHERGPDLKGGNRPSVVSELIGDLPNLRQAWHWASCHQRAWDLNQSADTLFWLYESRSNCREGVPLYRQAVQGLQIGPEQVVTSENWAQHLALGQVLTYEGFFLFRQGQQPQGRDVLKSALTILEKIPTSDSRDVQMALSNAIVFLGTVISEMGDFEEGNRLLHEGLHRKQQLEDHWGSAFCLRKIALAAYYRGDYAKSSETLQQSLEISEKIGNTWSLAASLSQLGLVAYSLGDYEQAHQFLSEALALSQTLEDRASIAAALDGLGLVKTAQGQFGDAQSLLEKSSALWKEIGEQGNLAQTLNHLGDVLLKMDDKERARRHFLDALSVANNMQIIPVLMDALMGVAEIQTREGAFASALETLILIHENPSSSRATKTRAEELQSEIKSQLPPQRVRNIKSRVNQKTVEFAVTEILGVQRSFV
jgi:predicted ATPase/DNA-binding XRE family transcriptional regulator/Flp pilus assembly protein TadD